MKYTKAMRQADFFRRMSEAGFTYSEAQRLRRIEMTLHRWAEAECNGEIERRVVGSFALPCKPRLPNGPTRVGSLHAEAKSQKASQAEGSP